jgi:hypothetical protein
MNDFVKWVGKILLHCIMWVFVLSVQWDGKSLFYYANETLVQNQLVQTVDEELGQLWSKLSRTAKMTFSESLPEEQKSM